MIADFEDFATWMYVIVDDCWKQISIVDQNLNQAVVVIVN